MAKTDLPTPEELRKLLRYEPDTGKLFWRARSVALFSSTGRRSANHACALWNSRFAGKEAFTADDGGGYKSGGIFCRLHRAHRVIWALHHDEWPTHEIDHINGVKDDNRIVNLRDVSHIENSRNTRRSSNNTSGHMGVGWNKARGKWEARIKVGRQIYLGLFDVFEDAVAARKAAEIKYGFHENHGA